jgi:hypothetical protein
MYCGRANTRLDNRIFVFKNEKIIIQQFSLLKNISDKSKFSLFSKFNKGKMFQKNPKEQK